MKTMSNSFVLVAKFYIKNNYFIKSKFNCNENKFLQKIIDNNTFRGKKLGSIGIRAEEPLLCKLAFYRCATWPFKNDSLVTAL